MPRAAAALCAACLAAAPFAILPAGASGGTDSLGAAREHFLRAREAERTGDAEAALAEYARAFEGDPGSRDLCFLYLGKLTSAGAVDAAVETARACERLSGDSASLDLAERKLLGAAALRAGDRAGALRHYRAAHQQDAEDADVLLVLAGLHEIAGDWEGYIEATAPLLRRLGYPPALMDRVARAYARLDRPEEAILPLLREAWEATENPAYGRTLAMSYESMDLPLSLLAVSRRLAAAHPSPGHDWLLARAYASAGRPDSALEVTARLLKDPAARAALPGVRYLQASLLFERGRYKESLRQAEALARDFPEVSAHHLLAGSAALELRARGAREALGRALALSPLSSDVRARLAYADLARGDTASASARLAYPAGEFPDVGQRLLLEGAAHGRLARELEPRGAWERAAVFSDSAAARRHRREAVSRYESVLALNSGDPVALFEAGAHLERLGEIGRAKAFLRKLVARDTAHAMAMNYLAYTLIEQDTVSPGEMKESRALLARALALSPENGAYLDSKGWWHHRAGEHDSAVAWLEAAADAMPGDPEVLEHLALARHAAGDRAGACAAWRRLRALDPARPVFLHCPAPATGKARE